MSKKGTGKFIAGALLGVGLGLLFAPQSGSETRKELKNKTKKLANDIKNIDPEELKKKLEKKIRELKKDLENLDRETAMELVKEKGQMLLLKAEDLMDLAREKSAPIVEDAAREVREKTIHILKNTVNALEKKQPKIKTVTKAKPKMKTKPKTTKKKTA